MIPPVKIMSNGFGGAFRNAGSGEDGANDTNDLLLSFQLVNDVVDTASLFIKSFFMNDAPGKGLPPTLFVAI